MGSISFSACRSRFPCSGKVFTFVFLAYQNRHDAARHRVVEQAVWLARWFASGRDLFPEHELNNLNISCIIACQVAYSLVIGAYSTAEPGKSRRTTFRCELSRSPSFGVLAVPAFTHQRVALVLRYRARSGAWCRVPGGFRSLDDIAELEIKMAAGQEAR